MSDSIIKKLDEINDRVVRVESRLVQLMYYMGADPMHKTEKGAFFWNYLDTPPCQRNKTSSNI